MEILGIDIGGTGIKGAPVDIDQGALTTPRRRIPTPEPSKPAAVAQVIAEIARQLCWSGAIGCGFPGVVRDGVVLSAANMNKDWVGIEAQALLRDATGCPVVVTNDADAAGVAEMRFGAGRDRKGVVLVVTIGTGLGTALFVDGVLVPNTEFGHIEIDCFDAESRASDAARQRDKLSWKKWTRRFDRYLNKLEELLSPNLIILGGGASKRHERFIPQLTVQTQVVPAELLNDAGIIGAALVARGLVDERNPA